MIKPTNEQGVVVLFQELSKQMGYKLVSDDVILKSMAGGNMIIFTVVLLGMFVFSKTNEQ